MANVNYTIILSSGLTTTLQNSLSYADAVVSSFRIRIYFNGAVYDEAEMSAAIFGDAT